jgi:hypothetical protein
LTTQDGRSADWHQSKTNPPLRLIQLNLQIKELSNRIPSNFESTTRSIQTSLQINYDTSTSSTTKSIKQSEATQEIVSSDDARASKLFYIGEGLLKHSATPDEFSISPVNIYPIFIQDNAQNPIVIPSISQNCFNPKRKFF